MRRPIRCRQKSSACRNESLSKLAALFKEMTARFGSSVTLPRARRVTTQRAFSSLPSKQTETKQMGNGTSLLPTEQDSALLSDETLAALKSLPEGSQQELAALYKLREMAEPEVVEVSTPRVAPVESAAAAAVETPVEAAKAAFEAALEEADEDQDKVVALAVEYALALQKSPGELPPEGFYTSEESIFEALMPRGDGGIAPVKLLKTEWIKERAAKIKAATTDDERRKLRLPRRQDLERDEPEAFMSVERLKELPRGHEHGVETEARGRRLVVLLADARAPGPARRAARIVGGGHREGGDGRTQYIPIRGGDFHRFRLSLPKRSRFVGALLRRADLQAARGADGGGGRGGGRVRGEPQWRGAGGVWRRAVVNADLVRAPDAHGLPHAHAAGGL